MDQLSILGWNKRFARHFNKLKNQGYFAARVVATHRKSLVVRGIDGDVEAVIPGRLRHEATSGRDLPGVGDWVACEEGTRGSPAAIRAVLPRTSLFSRIGMRGSEQIIAANVDFAFLVSGLDEDLNLRRIERYLTLAWDSGAEPVVLLNKADLRDDLADVLASVRAIAGDAEIHALSAATGDGLNIISEYLGAGTTGVFLGSSGVGKSSIVNCVLGNERQKTAANREADGRGRHTTTNRELIVVPSGGIVIDTPGMRELQIHGADDEGLAGTFPDVEALAAECRFRNCAHEVEPGCAVRDALKSGGLDAARYASYSKLKAELAARRSRPGRAAGGRRRKPVRNPQEEGEHGEEAGRPGP